MKYVRAETDRLLRLISDGVVSSEQVVTMCMKYMSEGQVADMVDCNELSVNYEETNDIMDQLSERLMNSWEAQRLILQEEQDVEISTRGSL